MSSFLQACRVCGDKFTSIRGLNIHLNVHKDNVTIKTAVEQSKNEYTMFKCQFCPMMFFDSRNQFYQHLQDTHPIVKFAEKATTISSASLEKSKAKVAETHICKICAVQVKTLKSLQEHIKIKHLEPDRNFSISHIGMKCENCDLKFKTKKVLSEHVRYHHKKTSCPLCKEKFPSRIDAKRHFKNVHKKVQNGDHVKGGNRKAQDETLRSNNNEGMNEKGKQTNLNEPLLKPNDKINKNQKCSKYLTLGKEKLNTGQNFNVAVFESGKNGEGIADVVSEKDSIEIDDKIASCIRAKIMEDQNWPKVCMIRSSVSSDSIIIKTPTNTSTECPKQLPDMSNCEQGSNERKRTSSSSDTGSESKRSSSNCELSKAEEDYNTINEISVSSKASLRLVQDVQRPANISFLDPVDISSSGGDIHRAPTGQQILSQIEFVSKKEESTLEHAKSFKRIPDLSRMNPTNLNELSSARRECIDSPPVINSAPVNPNTGCESAGVIVKVESPPGGSPKSATLAEDMGVSSTVNDVTTNTCQAGLIASESFIQPHSNASSRHSNSSSISKSVSESDSVRSTRAIISSRQTMFKFRTLASKLISSIGKLQLLIEKKYSADEKMMKEMYEMFDNVTAQWEKVEIFIESLSDCDNLEQLVDEAEILRQSVTKVSGEILTVPVAMAFTRKTFSEFETNGKAHRFQDRDEYLI